MIPRRLVRVVPEETTEQVELWWKQAMDLHPGWNFKTLRDPIDSNFFPLTRDLWPTCKSGAQLADLVRTEELYHRGGIYLDSDVEVYKSFRPLIEQQAFAGYDCVDYVPNAVMGFAPHHPALLKVLEGARERHHIGTWDSGVRVTSEVFPAYDDILLLPPGSFYPVFWRTKNLVDWSRVRDDNPWAFCAHHAHHSWSGT